MCRVMGAGTGEGLFVAPGRGFGLHSLTFHLKLPSGLEFH